MVVYKVYVNSLPFDEPERYPPVAGYSHTPLIPARALPSFPRKRESIGASITPPWSAFDVLWANGPTATFDNASRL